MTKRWEDMNRDEKYRLTHREQRRLYMAEYHKTHRQQDYVYRQTTAMGATASNRRNLRRAGRLGAPTQRLTVWQRFIAWIKKENR